MSLTTDVLHELFEYREGKLYNRFYRSNLSIAGQEAGSDNGKGYLKVWINNHHYFVHRVIYQMFHGHIPRNMQIDHINRNKKDNRIENLRVVNNAGNQQNVIRKKGYCFNPKRNNYRVRIQTNDKRIEIGSFNTEEEARAAYLKAKEHYHGVKV